MASSLLPDITQAEQVFDKELRGVIESAGLELLPSGFYYAVPSLKDISESFEYKEDHPFENDDLFNKQHLDKELDSLIEFSAEFTPPHDDDPENPASFFWNNDQFTFSDALAYYAMIRREKPARVVEIGSGFSTLIAVEALRRNGTGEIICIEPYPRKFLRGLPVELRQTPIQNLNAAWMNERLGDGDLLFIDSTHTVKTGSDCVHIYLRLLPAINRHIKVHVHDVFLPNAVPRHWLEDLHLYWSEAYLLMAYLLDNPRIKIDYSSSANAVYNRAKMEAFNAGRSQVGGSSIWFDFKPR